MTPLYLVTSCEGTQRVFAQTLAPHIELRCHTSADFARTSSANESFWEATPGGCKFRIGRPLLPLGIESLADQTKKLCLSTQEVPQALTPK